MEVEVTALRAWSSSNVRIAVFLAGLAAVVSFAYIGGVVGPSPAAAATITVTTPDDADPPADDSECSLREAIDNANADAQTWDDCQAGTGNDTIVFDGGIALITLDAALPNVSDVDGLTIDGGSSVTISGANTYRPFAVDNGAGLTLKSLTSTFGLATGSDGGNVLNNGTLTLIDSLITNSNATFNGGGIFNDGGTVTLDDSDVTGNTAVFGGGIFNTSDGEVQLISSHVTGNSATNNAGGIGNSFDSTLTLTNSSVTGNTAANYGGGINSSGDVTLTDSVVSGNTATAFGGGGFESEGTLMITNSTISDNTAATRGGGIDNVEGADATIIDSTISGNSGGDEGGGIFMEDAAILTMTGSTLSGNSATTGGGLRINGSTATLANNTVSDNEAGFGGGIYNGDGATTTLINVTISQNVASTSGGGLYNPGDAAGDFMLTNTIVADQQSGGDCGGSGSFVTQGNNLDSDNTCNLNPGTDIPGGSANLAALADNGGSTETHALLVGSDAIDAGDDTDCAASPVDSVDQRGVTRPQLAQCDIGAFELVPATPTPTPTGTPPEGESVVWGDHNCSGSADPVDSLLTLRHDAGLGANTGDCPNMGQVVDVQNASPHPWGDVDCGGEVTPVDSLKLLRFDAGLSVAQASGCPPIGVAVTVTE